MIKRICQLCKKEFEVYQSVVRIGKGKYCSHKCSSLSTRGRIPWNKGIKHSEKTKKKMSKTQKGKGTKSNNSNWKGGTILKDGRWIVLKPEHPFTTKLGYVFRYRLIAEKLLKRYLTHKEIIHHIDGNKSNDNPENLYLFNSSGEHSSFHFSKKSITLKSNLI